MMGGHCIKTWSATQGAYALSSAEAELYAMVEGVTRAKGLRSLAKELGFGAISNVCKDRHGQQRSEEFCLQKGVRQDEAFGDQRYVAAKGSGRRKS